MLTKEEIIEIGRCASQGKFISGLKVFQLILMLDAAQKRIKQLEDDVAHERKERRRTLREVGIGRP